MNFNMILPDLFVGSFPEGRKDIERLQRTCGITAVLNLQSDEDLRERGLDWCFFERAYKVLKIDARRVSMRDFDYHNQRQVLPQAVRVLAQLLACGHITYLHCNAGMGRSPLVAMAYLYWCRGISLWEAIRYVEIRRPCSPYDDLLEICRDDLLKDDEAQQRIRQRASRLPAKHDEMDTDSQAGWQAAEEAVLRELLGVSS
jgi:hypothetical protein